MRGRSRHLSAEEAQLEAQKIAFGPIMFQVARILHDSGILVAVRETPGIQTAALSEVSGLSEYACTVLLEAGLGASIVVQDDAGGWSITKVGYFLLQDPLTRVNMDFVQHICYQAMSFLEDSLRKGKPEGLKALGDWPTIYEGLMLMDPKASDSWLAFDHYYSDGSFPEAVKIVMESKPRRILDVGGNVGKFAVVCCEESPEVEVTIVDLPNTLERAEAFVAEAGFADRVRLHPADLLDSSQLLPAGHDLIWMSQFLCCFSEDEVVSILERAHNTLADGGKLVVMDTFWDVQHYDASAYCLQATSLYFTCLANGNSRMYDVKTMRRCLKEAGFKVDRQHDDIGLAHAILECSRD